jgi:integrase
MPQLLSASLKFEFPLPSVAQTCDGVHFDPTEDQWRIVTNTEVTYWNFKEFRSVVSEELHHCWKYQCYRELKDGDNPRSAHNRYVEFRNLVEFLHRTQKRPRKPIEEISLEDVLALKAAYSRTEEFHVSWLRAFLEAWVDRGIPGVDPDLVPVLKQFRLKNNRTGHIVGSLTRGRFSDVERSDIEKAVALEIASGIGGGNVVAQDTLALLLLLDLGCRPASLCWLKVCDLQVKPGMGLREGRTEYVLFLPLPKKRGRLARQVMIPKPLRTETGDLLLQYITDLKNRYHHLGLDDLLPFFLRELRTDNPPGFLHHHLVVDFDRMGEAAFKRMGLKEEGTDEPLNFSSYRFRYSYGTQVARETKSQMAVAAALNHEDDRCAKIYTDWIRTADPRIDEAAARKFGPIFRKACCHDPEEQAVEDGLPRVSMPKRPKESLGKCGQHRGCYGPAPKACLLCPHFHPRLRAPWGDLLRDLISEQDWIIGHTPYQEEVPNLLRVHGELIWACADLDDRCQKRILAMEPKEGVGS